MLTEVCVFTLATTNTCDLAALTSLVKTANQVGFLFNSLQWCILKDVTIATVCVVSDPCVRKKCSATCSTNGVNCTCDCAVSYSGDSCCTGACICLVYVGIYYTSTEMNR